MIKKIILTLIFCSLLFSCGKKGDPEYKNLDQKVEEIIVNTNKA